MKISTEAQDVFIAEAAYKGVTPEALQTETLETQGRAYAELHKQRNKRELVEAILAHHDLYEGSREPAQTLSALQAEIAAKQIELEALEAQVA